MGEPEQTEKIPALIFADKDAVRKIAGLTVLDRLVVAIHRAGIGPIIILPQQPFPSLRRTLTLEIPITIADVVPKLFGPVLVARANLLVQSTDVRRCVELKGTLKIKESDGSREFIGMGVVDAGSEGTPELLSLNAGGPLKELSVETLTASRLPEVESTRVAQIIDGEAAARCAERALWASMKSSADGFVDRVFNRPLGRFLSKVLVHTPVSPNMVSIASILIGVIAAVFFAEGSFRSTLIGAILFQFSAIVDCVDGEIARILFKESPLGKWIDLVGDQIVHISVFAGVAFGVLRNGGGEETVFLGLSAVLGALISFAVVVRGMRQANSGNSLLQKLIDSATNRDFSVIVLALAIMQKLHWFLWMAGIGSHLFWITALGLQLAHKPAPPERAR
jgi:phosphatidylglycerophosphate synthase